MSKIGPNQMGVHCDSCKYESVCPDMASLEDWLNRPCPQCGHKSMVTPEEVQMAKEVIEPFLKKQTTPPVHFGNQIFHKTLIRANQERIEVDDVSAKENLN